MRRLFSLSLAAGVGAFALGCAEPHSAKAADLPIPQARMQPPDYYGPPPAEEGYAYPPPAVYGYPPPPPVAYYPYAAPPYAVVPGPYYVRGPYWRGYGPHFAYGYGHWGRGYRRW